jgi:putative Holliday junction resolvase
MSCILALDVGTKTIGIARASLGASLASPHSTLSRQGVKKDVARLVSLCDAEKAGAVVVGLPYELDGTEGRSARLARQVGDALAAASGLPVHYQDERYSTVEASRRLHEAGHSARAQRQIIDQAAAAVILEDWLKHQD